MWRRNLTFVQKTWSSRVLRNGAGCQSRSLSISHYFGSAKQDSEVSKAQSSVEWSSDAEKKVSSWPNLGSMQKLPGLAVSGSLMTIGFACADKLGAVAFGTAAGCSPISGIPVTIALGVLLNNTLRQSLDRDTFSEMETWLSPGFTFASKAILQAGIVCIGSKLSLLDVFSLGMTGIPIVFVTVGSGFVFIKHSASLLGVPPKMALLIASGTSICGVTAISAVAPVIKASKEDTSFAIANVVAFGTLGMLTMPYLAHYGLFPPDPLSALQVEQIRSTRVGLFLGLSVHDTSQVLGSAMTYNIVFNNELALKMATVTKLTRNLCLAAVVPAMGVLQSRIDSGSGVPGNGVAAFSLQSIKKYVPGFVIAFLALSCLRTGGDYLLQETGDVLLLSGADWKQLVKFLGNDVGQVCLGTAMASVGLTTNLAILKGICVFICVRKLDMPRVSMRFGLRMKI